MRTNRATNYLAAAAIAAALGLSACGGEGDPEPTPPPAAGNSTSADQSAWQQRDPCALLTKEDTKEYLGEEAATVTGQRTDTVGRPRCEWKAKGSGDISLMLWQPPAPDIVTDSGKETVPVAGTKGYIIAETGMSCHMDVAAEPAFLQFDVSASNTGGSEPNFCATVAKTAEKVLTKLGG